MINEADPVSEIPATGDPLIFFLCSFQSLFFPHQEWLLCDHCGRQMEKEKIGVKVKVVPLILSQLSPFSHSYKQALNNVACKRKRLQAQYSI